MSTKHSLVWEAPPERRTHSSKWQKIAAELRSRPGEWARICEVGSISLATNTAGNIRRGNYKGIVAGEFETRSVTPKDGPYYVYARYVGKPVRAVS